MRVPPLTVAALALVTSAIAAHAAEPIKLGCVAALSGAGADIGTRLREGAELAIAARPEIGGRPVQLLVRDSKSDPSVAQQQAASLQSEGVSGLLCSSLSSEGAALSAAARAGRMPVPNVLGSAVADEITGKNCNQWTFRVVPSATTIAHAVARFTADQPKVSAGGFYILGSDYLYGRSSGHAFSEIPGIKLVGESYAPLDTADWTPYLNKISQSGATGLWLPVALGSPYVQLMVAANAMKLLQRVTVMAPTGLPQEIIDQLGDAAVGAVEPASAVMMTQPASIPVAEAYRAKFGRAPSEGVLQSYVATSIMLQAVASAKDTTPAAVRDALQGGSFDTIVGRVRFRKGDQQAIAPVWSGRIEKLATPVAGSAYGFVAVQKQAAEDVMPPLEQTGCVPR
jgi:branched-chain amino acid transport system substrate-binding protein